MVRLVLMMEMMTNEKKDYTMPSVTVVLLSENDVIIASEDEWSPWY